MARTTRSFRGLTALSIRELRAEIARQAEQLTAMVGECDDLVARIAGREPSRRRRTYARNPMTLLEALAAALRDRTLGVPEAVEAVRRRGYKSDSPNFKLIVNTVLSRPPFKRVSRGRYTLGSRTRPKKRG